MELRTASGSGEGEAATGCGMFTGEDRSGKKEKKAVMAGIGTNVVSDDPGHGYDDGLGSGMAAVS